MSTISINSTTLHSVPTKSSTNALNIDFLVIRQCPEDAPKHGVRTHRSHQLLRDKGQKEKKVVIVYDRAESEVDGDVVLKRTQFVVTRLKKGK
jgi:hypothetical protein